MGGKPRTLAEQVADWRQARLDDTAAKFGRGSHVYQLHERLVESDRAHTHALHERNAARAELAKAREQWAQALAAGVGERRYTWTEAVTAFRDQRDISDPCKACDGWGRRAYGSTATWHGGIGGQMVTGGICDKCWGSGDASRSGVDLRRLVAVRAAVRQANVRCVSGLDWHHATLEIACMLDELLVPTATRSEEPGP